MDENHEIRSKREEKCIRRGKSKAICRETGDHVHYPPTRLTRPTRPSHAPSPIRFRFTRKARYGECRKNQAVGIGCTAYDGCGEFVSSTAREDSVNCAACGCHRSFHREESNSDAISVQQRETCTTEAVLGVLKLSSYQFRQIFCSPYGSGKSGGKESSGGDRIAIDRSGGGDLVEEEAVRGKRLKTKFTAEQTEKMRNYAEKIRWKVNPERREEVDEFCTEIGVNRKNFMIWMSNHKNKN